jgi:hypothetical protein
MVAQLTLRFGHLLVGLASLVVAGAMVMIGRAPGAELEGVLTGLGVILAMPAAAFTCAAVVLLRCAKDDGRGWLSLVLSIVELGLGLALVVSCATAVRGYGVFQPWRSPLLPPSVLLVALGLAGIALEVVGHRAWPRSGEPGR